MNKLEQAKEYHKKGDWEKANELYEELLSSAPENEETLYLYATARMHQNDIEKSEELINKCLEIDEKNPLYLQFLGSIKVILKQEKEAFIPLKKAIKINPNLYQANTLLARLYSTNGDRINAKKHFVKALQVSGNSPQSRMNLAKFLIEDGDMQQGYDLLKELEHELPNNERLSLLLGQAFLETGSHVNAERYFKKAKSLNPKLEAANAYIGLSKLQSGNLKEAENLIMTFNQENKNTRIGLAAMGLLYFSIGNFFMAIRSLETVIGKGLAPLSWRGTLAEAYAKVGDLKPLTEFFEEQNLKKPNSVITLRLASLYEQQKKFNKAIKLYKKIDKNDDQFGLAQLGLARCHLHKKDLELAENLCKKLLKSNENNSEASYLLVISYLERKQDETALKILNELKIDGYEEAIKKDYKLLKGLIQDHMGDYKGAYTEFSSVEDKTDTNSLMPEEILKKIQNFEKNKEDDKKDPVFIIGFKSTGLYEFTKWIFDQGHRVLIDRLVSVGRQDILSAYIDINDLEKMSLETIKTARANYFDLAKELKGTLKQDNIIDSLHINTFQLGIVRKVFPNAKIIMLDRNTADIWLTQTAFGKEYISSEQWNETKNQILSMGFDLTQINIDEWIENKPGVIEKISEILGLELSEYKPEKINYWSRSHFPKDHWKNYTKFLGS